jgi:hypothetical protein
MNSLRPAEAEQEERRRPLERSRCRWADNNKKDLREISWSDMDWINLAQDRTLLNTVMNLWVP